MPSEGLAPAIQHAFADVVEDLVISLSSRTHKSAAVSATAGIM